ncbi:MAG: GAF domain-containing protein [Lentisphaerae bacterium]|nr:GAF domain-containing protein [Lentisphaerota bacterium]
MNAPSAQTTEQLRECQQLTRQVCAELGNSQDFISALKTVLKALKNFAACEAAAIRLRHDGDYPCYLWDGFPDAFIKQEYSLLRCDSAGNPIPELDGKGFELECMCGIIIRGRAKPACAFFTPGGSFWTNSTTDLMATSTEQDRQVWTRDYCNACGYESVALVPLKARNQTLGLLQLNDHHRDRFAFELIEHLELLAAQIALAAWGEALNARLQQTVMMNGKLHRLLSVCSHCHRIKNSHGRWHSFESYLTSHVKMRVSHGLCPVCAKERYPDLHLATNNDLDQVVDFPSPEAPPPDKPK